MTADHLRVPSFPVLLVLAWAVASGMLVWQFGKDAAVALGDTDDAMRLVELRAFLAGRGWFDLVEPRAAAPLGYATHWSRLIDLGLAGHVRLLSAFVDAGLAERWTRIAWPLLWLAPAMAMAGLIAWRLGGREAALVVLVFTLLGLPAFQQFKPGRIDHHNVQIVLALTTLAATVWSDRLRWAAAGAGLCTGLALAIGMEALPYLAACGAGLVLRALSERAANKALGEYGLALAGGTGLAFVLDVAPEHWTRSACDAMAVNWAVPIVLAGLGLGAMSRIAACARMPVRVALAAAIAGLALLAFVLIEPRCIAGPYALMEEAAKPVWLARVQEMQPLTALFRDSPQTTVFLAAFPAMALLATLVLAFHRERRRDPAFLIAAATLVLACVTTVTVIKGSYYANWFGMPLMALLALDLSKRLSVDPKVARLLFAVLLAPGTIAGLGDALVQSVGRVEAANAADEREACFKTQSYGPFAKLAPGLVATAVDYGPFLLALTPHSVIAAPYHRLGAGIVLTHQLFSEPAEEARATALRLRAAYVAVCGSTRPAGLGEAALSDSLWGRLRAGEAPAWLERIPGAPGQAFAIYRVKPQVELRGALAAPRS